MWTIAPLIWWRGTATSGRRDVIAFGSRRPAQARTLAVDRPQTHGAAHQSTPDAANAVGESDLSAWRTGCVGPSSPSIQHVKASSTAATCSTRGRVASPAAHHKERWSMAIMVAIHVVDNASGPPASRTRSAPSPTRSTTRSSSRSGPGCKPSYCTSAARFSRTETNIRGTDQRAGSPEGWHVAPMRLVRRRRPGAGQFRGARTHATMRFRT